MAQKRLSQDELITRAKRLKSQSQYQYGESNEYDGGGEDDLSQQSIITQTIGQPQPKIFNDPVHGHIELHPLCLRIIDTSQFQRLRYIKQLGCTFYVYPGASNTRFEHSIGVGHLATQLVRNLQMRQPELNITDIDVLCVGIAGLCHDLGHGVLSHLFDNAFLPRVLDGKRWRHEEGSVKMFEHLIQENDLLPEFERYSLDECDLMFIKEQIVGPANSNGDEELQGRGPEKKFLYEIVANHRNGIDVDKWDYFARDALYLGLSISFDYKRFMHFVRAIQVNNKWQLCTRDIEVDHAYDMFYTRLMLHKRAYQHKTVKLIESMVVEALIKANDHLMFTGRNNKKFKLSETINDMVAYSKVTDYVLQQIRMSDDSNLDESRQILEAIEKRKLYKCVRRTMPMHKDKLNKSETQIQEEIAEYSKTLCRDRPLKKSDVHVRIVNLDYGMKDKDPIQHMRFYSKYDNNRALTFNKQEVSKMLPESFNEEYILVYSKSRDGEIAELVKQCSIKWCNANDLQKSKSSKVDELLTPVKKVDKTRDEYREANSLKHLHFN